MIGAASTGDGKTYIHLCVADLYLAGVTVVVVPTNALRVSVAEACAKVGIPFKECLPGCVGFENPHKWPVIDPTRVVIVVADTATSSQSKFPQFLHVMGLRGLVNRVVVDEAQLVLEAADYRPGLKDLGKLGSMAGGRSRDVLEWLLYEEHDWRAWQGVATR